MLHALRARFDGVALRAPLAAADEADQHPRHAAAWQALQRWCDGPAPDGSGRMAVASLASARADDAALQAWANAFARTLDGSLLLQAQPGAAGRWALRLRVKAQDALGALGRRARQPGDPWDAGWAACTPPALRQWPKFAPRRATLVLALASDADLLQLPMALLRQRSDAFGHPTRWLWVGSPAVPLPKGQGPALLLD